MPPWIEGPIYAIALFCLMFGVGMALLLIRPVLSVILWTIIDIIALFWWLFLIAGVIAYFVLR